MKQTLKEIDMEVEKGKTVQTVKKKIESFFTKFPFFLKWEEHNAAELHQKTRDWRNCN